MPPDPHDLDLDVLEDMRFQEGDWRRERVGWAVMVLIVIGAVLGAFGHGLLGYRTATSADGGVAVTHEAVARRGGVTDIEVRVDPDLAGDALQLHLSTSYLERVQVETITPQPSDAVPSGDGITFEFTTDDVDPGTDIVIRFGIRPDTVGVARGEVGLVGGPSMDIDQVLLP
ncbi:hypothetical protein [Actinomarinicola tropica]|uniref:Uncharacterized protein n=1 Tax=Actinomarinicola tropica TaxID=2789776 RepID=A0A5Q2RLD8_9ACTN|nr:hypothetical protein [Actinomarinicola tropica]QGG95742.1 hypothetical protein GH723_11890 [Actinomarinicola tropica]